MRASLLISLGLFSGLAAASPASEAVFLSSSEDASATKHHKNKSNVDPSKFKNKGLVAIGQFPANLRDSNNETLGGLGSSAGLVPGKLRKGADGSMHGSIYLQPDRGYNVEATIDYVARHHLFDFSFREYTGDANLTFEEGKNFFNLTYRTSTFYHEAVHGRVPSINTTGLNPKQTRSGGLLGNNKKAALLPTDDKNAPQRISLDTEGFVANPDGTFWVSDEYGPYMYKVSASGEILSYIAPPASIIPEVDGKVNFNATDDSTTGRGANHGFEGLTVSFDGKELFAILQSATIQDGGADSKTARYSRLVRYDVSSLDGVHTPRQAQKVKRGAKLTGEWMVPAPTSSKGKARDFSELAYLAPNLVAVLARDGNGFGDSDTDVKYKHADVIDISKATNIACTKFDKPSTPAAPGGKLDAAITPANYVPLVDFLPDLPRFGMHAADEPVDPTLIAAKIESLVLLPVLGSDSENDYYFLSVSDNDFQTKNGYMRALGDYSVEYPQDVPTQIFVFRVELPGVDRKALLKRLGL